MWQRSCAALLIVCGLALGWYGVNAGWVGGMGPLRWVGFLTGMGGVLWYVLIRLQDRRMAAESPPGCCRRCGYDLTGNVSGVCPECGLPAPQLPRLRQSTGPRPPRR